MQQESQEFMLIFPDIPTSSPSSYILHLPHKNYIPNLGTTILHLCFMSTAKPRSFVKPSLGRNLSCLLEKSPLLQKKSNMG
jgi:hypothetical protein